MTIQFDTETIRLITLFENLSGATVKDCIIDNENNLVYFVVGENQAKFVIGKNGFKIKNIERILKKRIRIFEFSDDVQKFVKNLIPKALEIKIVENQNEKVIIVKVDKTERPSIIGRNGRNLKILRKLLERNHKIKNLIIR
ncbi:MAG: transcription elongation factor NusA [Candidatus Aenigmarchaeota archaeon ex4484_224]|nr:MAG: transcription elongation factor NusA [Candidatus Aenigmarchaeota archaeon ex4484_224]